MNLTEPDAQALWREGAQALKSGQSAVALQAFRRLLASGREEPAVWFAVALACRQTDDAPAMLQALDTVLAHSPRDIRALMMKGDHFTGCGDAVAAVGFYKAVARIGDDPGLPADLQAEVERARAASAASAGRFEAHLMAELEPAGFRRKEARRFRASMEMMLGRLPMLIQRPTQYFFPELPQVEFYDRQDTPWLEPVEQAVDDIREELLAVLRDEGAFTPYHEPTPDRPMFDRHGLIGNPSWSAFHLVKGGEAVDDHAERCPKTLAAVRQMPLCEVPGRSPSILFSLLRPGARIPPHHGLVNTRLICHLPLIVPGGCGFRVGSQTRPWVEGRAFAFDDSVEHEAWNNSGETRVVLIFDVWRPELTELERDLVSKTLQASSSFNATVSAAPAV